MNNLAPEITRQRLLVEGFYTIEVDHGEVVKLLQELPAHLGLRIYSDPIVFSPSGDGKEGNQGFDGFVPLIDSGISVYIWTKQKFFSIVLYTCKSFDEVATKSFLKNFFRVKGALEELSF